MPHTFEGASHLALPSNHKFSSKKNIPIFSIFNESYAVRGRVPCLVFVAMSMGQKFVFVEILSGIA